MRILISLAFICIATILNAQSTIGVTQYNNPNTDGYVLFSGVASTQTYLIDKCGKKVKQWSSSYKPGLSVYLLPDGNLFRTGLSSSSSFGTGGGKGGVLEKYDWSGNLLWSYIISDANQCQHHDAMVLANGNILAIVWERKTSADALQAGKNPTVTAALNNQEVWTEKIIELQPVGTNSANIVWEWKAWDHLIQDFDNTKSNFGVVSQNPALLNVNFVVQGPPTNSDWLHINSIDYDPVKDQILLSSHSFGEFWIIDHSTTTAQAASHTGGNSGKGGDLLYRWGNPYTYGRGIVGDQKLFKQHHATFIKPGFPNAGKVLVFNNGVNRPGGNYSSIDMIDISQAGSTYTIGATAAYLPATLFWTYTAPTPATFYATNIGGVYPLSNGSFLITDGPKGELVEIDQTSSITWRYTNPVNASGPMTQGTTTPTLNTVFRANFYPPDYSAFTSVTLTPTAEIEINPTNPSLCSVVTGIQEINDGTFNLYPNPVNGSGTIIVENKMHETYQVELFSLIGSVIALGEMDKNTEQLSIGLPDLKPGIYFIKLSNNSTNLTKKIIIN